MSVYLELPLQPDDHVRGNPDARVTLVEYGDFECGYCAAAFPIVEQLRARFAQDLRFVFRHAPQTRLHAHALMAAEATEAAGAQGRFWELHDRLFVDRAPLHWERLLDEATVLRLDLGRFEADVTSGRFREVVMRFARTGAHTVRGTPTFFLDGVRYEDASDAESLGAAIAARLRPL